MYCNISKYLVYLIILSGGYFAETTTKTIEDVQFNQQGLTVNKTCVASSDCAGKLLCYSEVCNCALEHFWSGSDCHLKKGYQENCMSSDECLNTFICDGTCRCSETDYWNGHTCTTRKPANTECSTTIECRDTLHCSRNVCQCFTTDYWNGSSCSLRKGIDSACFSTRECKDSMKCINGDCKCRESDFWDGKYCIDRKMVNMECSLPSECKKELICLHSRCQCPVSDFWDGSKCDKRKTFDEDCRETLECKDSLQCRLGKCLCNNTEYWSIMTCLPRKPVDSVCMSSKECKENLECTLNQICRCMNTYYWDGIRCSPKLPRDCSDIAAEKDGVYSIYPGGGYKMSVYCFMRGEKKWTVIQRRLDGSVDFQRSWREFRNGFGSVNGEYWLGNENIYLITNPSNGEYELSVYIEDKSHDFGYANYSRFYLENEANKYKLHCWSYSGNIGDQLCSKSNGKKFSTYDRDNDYTSSYHCSQNYGRIGWWFYNCNYYGSVNGNYDVTSSNRKGFYWNSWKSGYYTPLKASLLMIRRK